MIGKIIIELICGPPKYSRRMHCCNPKRRRFELSQKRQCWPLQQSKYFARRMHCCNPKRRRFELGQKSQCWPLQQSKYFAGKQLDVFGKYMWLALELYPFWPYISLGNETFTIFRYNNGAPVGRVSRRPSRTGATPAATIMAWGGIRHDNNKGMHEDPRFNYFIPPVPSAINLRDQHTPFANFQYYPRSRRNRFNNPNNA